MNSAIELIQSLLTSGYELSDIVYGEDVYFEDERENSILSVQAFLEKYTYLDKESENGLVFLFCVKKDNQWYQISSYHGVNQRPLGKITIKKIGAIHLPQINFMEYHVIPLKKVNDLEFGMSREMVREHLGDYMEFHDGDRFNNCFVYYKNSQLSAIELYGNYRVFVNDIIFESSDSLEESKRKMKLLDNDAYDLESYIFEISVDYTHFTIGRVEG